MKRNSKKRIIAPIIALSILLSGISIGAWADSAAEIGTYNHYNGIILSDADVNLAHHIEGAIAVGGNIRIGPNYSIGTRLQHSNNPNMLVGGGVYIRKDSNYGSISFESGPFVHSDSANISAEKVRLYDNGKKGIKSVPSAVVDNFFDGARDYANSIINKAKQLDKNSGINVNVPTWDNQQNKLSIKKIDAGGGKFYYVVRYKQPNQMIIKGFLDYPAGVWSDDCIGVYNLIEADNIEFHNTITRVGGQQLHYQTTEHRELIKKIYWAIPNAGMISLKSGAFVDGAVIAPNSETVLENGSINGRLITNTFRQINGSALNDVPIVVPEVEEATTTPTTTTTSTTEATSSTTEATSSTTEATSSTTEATTSTTEATTSTTEATTSTTEATTSTTEATTSTTEATTSTTEATTSTTEATSSTTEATTSTTEATSSTVTTTATPVNTTGTTALTTTSTTTDGTVTTTTTGGTAVSTTTTGVTTATPTTTTPTTTTPTTTTTSTTEATSSTTEATSSTTEATSSTTQVTTSTTEATTSTTEATTSTTEATTSTTQATTSTTEATSSTTEATTSSSVEGTTTVTDGTDLNVTTSIGGGNSEYEEFPDVSIPAGVITTPKASTTEQSNDGEFIEDGVFTKPTIPLGGLGSLTNKNESNPRTGESSKPLSVSNAILLLLLAGAGLITISKTRTGNAED